MQTQKHTKKSFVLRKGRVTVAQRRALNSLKKEHTIEPSKGELNVAEAFIEPDKKLIADVGFGSGESLLSMANKYQEANFVGIEVYSSGIGSVLNQIQKNKLTNLKIIESDVFQLLERNIADDTFDGIVFLYPDPWPKRKHHKRRLLSEGFLNLLYDKITTNGLVFCKTDWENYYYQIKEGFSADNRWVSEDLTNLPEYISSLPKTKYERKALIEGRRSRELFFSKA
ncbi:MAG: tRNA (guanosine(46)-N7)-methyltransferase TrmB [SAR86 cluster bacterium]|jgi:tRNA (guanine-N7-)-methyltransferase|nr:tRNA (guanosine(46)-N7)-methyltransferase TrmB [SAR86 cluster bacterium]